MEEQLKEFKFDPGIEEEENKKKTKNKENPGIKSLKEALSNVGLDSGFWQPLFTEHLQVYCSAALKYIDISGYMKMKKHARVEWEAAALKKLLDIEK